MPACARGGVAQKAHGANLDFSLTASKCQQAAARLAQDEQEFRFKALSSEPSEAAHFFEQGID